MSAWRGEHVLVYYKIPPRVSSSPPWPAVIRLRLQAKMARAAMKNAAASNLVLGGKKKRVAYGSYIPTHVG
jgi:hypothetical protein